MHEAIKALNEIKARGHIDTKYGKIAVRIVGGGDMLWINDCLGLGGFAGRFKCSWGASAMEMNSGGQSSTLLTRSSEGTS
jgi:hypothetical protein